MWSKFDSIMKKLFSLLAIIAISSALSAGNTYVKLTSVPVDWSGTYLIVCESQNVVFNGNADEENIDAKAGPAVLCDIVISNGIISGNEVIDLAVFTIEPTDDTDWPWAIKSNSGLYIGHKDTLDNGLSVETSIKKKCRHTLAIDENGNLVAIPYWQKGAAYNLQYNKKADQLRFRYFEPDDKEQVQIYRMQEASSLRDARTTSRVTKICEDGQIYILRDGVRLNILGTRL